MHICMVAFSDLHFDYRIFREATSLRLAGHRVSLVAAAFSQEPLPQWDGFEITSIPIDRCRSLRWSYPVFWRQARKYLLEARADAYHAHDLDSLWPAAQAASRRNVPLIYDSHELWTEQSSLVGRTVIRTFWQQLEKRLIPQVHRTIAVSESIARILQSRYKLQEVIVLRNLPQYRPPITSDRIRLELELAPQRPVVLYQGGFLTDNGLAEQIVAAASFGEAAFVLIGDGPCQEKLYQQVEKLNLERQVFFIPRVPFWELHSYTCSADLGLCLIKGTGKSFIYSMPNKLFEYLMAGLPVLVSDLPEMRQVIADTGAGFVVDPRNPAAVGALVRAILADEPQVRACRTAALNAARQLNWEQEAHRLLELYTGL